MKSFIYKSCLFLVILFAGIKAYSSAAGNLTRTVIEGQTFCIDLSPYFDKGDYVYLSSPINPGKVGLGVVSAHCMTGLTPSESGLYQYYKLTEDGYELRLTVYIQVISLPPNTILTFKAKISNNYQEFLKPKKLIELTLC